VASFDDLRKHVMEDARELMVVLGIYTPLVTDLAPGSGVIPDDYRRAASSLRNSSRAGWRRRKR
jgi:hypothetical protein